MKVRLTIDMPAVAAAVAPLAVASSVEGGMAAVRGVAVAGCWISTGGAPAKSAGV
jgi:hypothetical protein